MTGVVTDRLWEVSELVALLEAKERGLERIRCKGRMLGWSANDLVPASDEKVARRRGIPVWRSHRPFLGICNRSCLEWRNYFCQILERPNLHHVPRDNGHLAEWVACADLQRPTVRIN
jgi:hypothetical protein